MNNPSPASPPFPRASVRSRRIATIFLGVLVVAYLAIITLARIQDLVTVRQFFMLAVLWVLGVIALILLARSLKRLRRST
jgi:Na+/melibiose symporter-like transporter